MAAKTLEEAIAALSGPEKALFEKTLNDNPELKGGWLRQDDYSRKQTELQSKQAVFDEAVQYKEKMEPWAGEVYDKLKALQDDGVLDANGEPIWQSTKTELERRAADAEARALAGGDMTPEQINEAVRKVAAEAGIPLNKDEQQALYAKIARESTEATVKAKLDEATKDFNEKTIPLTTGIAALMATSAVRYERETGKEYTPEDHAKVVGLLAQHEFDPRKAMTAYMEPVLAAKKEGDKDAEIARLKTQLEESNRRMAGGGNEPFIPHEQQKGALAQMLERSKAGEAAPDVESVIAAQAVKAAGELRSEGKV